MTDLGARAVSSSIPLDLVHRGADDEPDRVALRFLPVGHRAGAAGLGADTFRAHLADGSGRCARAPTGPARSRRHSLRQSRQEPRRCKT